MSWQPVLLDEDATTAHEHIIGIAEALKTLLPRDEREARRCPRLLADLGVFFEYAGQCLESELYVDTARRFVNYAIDALPEAPMPASLYGGYSGVAWAVEYLSRSGRYDTTALDLQLDEDLNSEVDESLVALLQKSPWRAPYDLITGLVGYGVYFSERLHRESARRGMRLLIQRLDEMKVETEGGISWHTPPRLLPEWQRQVNPEGYYNVGVAHGVPGILAILAIAVAHDVLRETARPLLEGLVRWLRAVRQDARTVGSYFPRWWMPGRPPTASRQAWCYGDPGAAAAWLWAGILAGEQSWQDDALHVLRSCARVRTLQVGDACLCHGSAGLGHLYNRAYQATGVPDLRDAARYWLRVAFRHRGLEGYGGYRAYHPAGAGSPKSPQQDPWESDPSFLMGSAGTGLAYLAAISDIEPEWDRLLLVSLPPKAGTSRSHR